MVEKVEDIESKIRLVKRPKEFQGSIGDSVALKQIMEAIVALIDDGKARSNVCA
jgi:hypothetical protein